MNLPQPQQKNYAALISDIEQGRIKIPQFQRNFVWTLTDSARLLDSIVKGYPIGAFIMWRTQETLRCVRDLGGFRLPETRAGETASYVLDGQQRITSLYAAIKGIAVRRDGKTEDFSGLCLNLTADDDEDIVLPERPDGKDACCIPLTTLLNGGIATLAAYPAEFLEKIDRFRQNITNYPFSLIELPDAPIDVATDVFTRLNVGGKSLTVFEIMVAKSYDAERGFDLVEQFDALKEHLKTVDYELIPAQTVLQAAAVVLTKNCRRKDILSLNKQKFIDAWPSVVAAIRRTVDFFRQSYRIPVARLLPYNALIVPFAYFFHRHPADPVGVQAARLQAFFWRCALSERYSSAVETKLAQDIGRMDDILAGRAPEYDWHTDVSAEFLLRNGRFSLGRSYIKAILCLYAAQQPQSFASGKDVSLSNDALIQSNSRNFHHFFPTAFLRTHAPDQPADHVLNITLVDDHANKNLIRARAPSDYMREFSGQNPDLAATINTHFINDLQAFGIWDDNYPAFLAARAAAVSDALDRLIHHTESP